MSIPFSVSEVLVSWIFARYIIIGILQAQEGAMCVEGRPDLRIAIDNLKQHLPVGKKLGLFIKNSFIKISRLNSCCGHPGEPGC